MTKFAVNHPSVRKAVEASIMTVGRSPQVIHTGGGNAGYIPSDAHTELFNAAVSGLLSDQFYESGDARIQRLIDLVPKCDPRWLVSFIAWLRSEAFLRSASVVLAAEYVRAGFPEARKVVASALKRPDEPGEILGYWIGRYGRSIPAALKRGVADATQSLFNESALLRYDGQNKDWRLGDVLEVVHPKPKADWQSSLFKFALDRRRHTPEVPSTLKKVAATLAAEAVPQDLRDEAMFLSLLNDEHVDFSWERASTWYGKSLTPKIWESLIPRMGYMALLRNLNNFDRSGTNPQEVIERLVSADEIVRSRVLPFRFLTAYANLEGDTYRVALQDAADKALSNLPFWEGHTLILVDRSGSMGSPVGAGKSRNPLRLSQLAGFYGESLARRCAQSTVYSYDDRIYPVEIKPSIPVLRASTSQVYSPRGSTNTWGTVRETVRREHDRIIILTDEQHNGRNDPGPALIPIITWNLAGYQVHHAPHGVHNRFLVSGYSDTTLQTLPAVISHGSTGRWPWEQV